MSEVQTWAKAVPLWGVSCVTSLLLHGGPWKFPEAASKGWPPNPPCPCFPEPLQKCPFVPLHQNTGPENGCALALDCTANLCEHLSEESPIWIYLHISTPSHTLAQLLHKHSCLFAQAPTSVFLWVFVFPFSLACDLPSFVTHAHAFPYPAMHVGIVAPGFTREFAANAFVDKAVNKYFPARVSLNKCSHEYSFASKFLDKSSSVHIRASTCFGICLSIRIWRYTCLKIHIHMQLCMWIQVQSISPRALLFYPHLFSPDAAAVS